MQRAFKTEIQLTKDQQNKFKQSVGVCRWLYNFYLDKNMELYQMYKDGHLDKKNSFMSANDFNKYINTEVKVLNDFQWINNCGSKARKKSIVNAELAFKRFFKGQSKFPRFKKKNRQDVNLYFPKNNKGDWIIARHRIKIPTFGWVQLKEKGYIPIDKTVISGTISQKANRYYVSVIMNCVSKTPTDISNTDGIGIDLGIKHFAITSDGFTYPNINKTSRVKKLEKKLRREQRRLSRKYEGHKKSKNKKEGSAARQNIQKQVLSVQKVHQRLSNIRMDYINKVSSEIAERNPSFVTMEDLNIKSMMKNRHLSKSISQQKFYQFRVLLESKLFNKSIELRFVDTFYPSSKLCSDCGDRNANLKLSDRVFHCVNCGTSIDRDFNASLNLKSAKEYKIAN